MRSIFITVFAVLVTATSYGQTQQQINLISNFFSRDGMPILQDLAHPLCSGQSVSVQASYPEHTYDITLHYQFGSQNFTCKYRLELNSTGGFLRLRMNGCGDKNGSCFLACRFANFEKITSSEDKDRYERYLGISLKRMHCEQYALVKLYYEWKDKGYYEKY